MSEPQKHHYVPQWHLRQWLSKDNKLQSYYRLENNQLSSQRISPKAVAYERNLYSWLNPGHPQKQQLEKEFFQQLDSDAARAAKVLRDSGAGFLSERDKQNWAKYLSASVLRLPLELNKLKGFSKATDLQILMEMEQRKGKNKLTSEIEWLETANRLFPGFFEDRALDFLVEYLQSDEAIEPWLQLQWWTEEAEDAQYSLLTSDKPLVISGVKGDENGLLAFFPISPYRIFCATNTPLLASLISSGASDFIVNWSNNLQIKVARNYLFAKDDTLKWHIEKFFGDDFPNPPLPE